MRDRPFDFRLAEEATGGIGVEIEAPGTRICEDVLRIGSGDCCDALGDAHCTVELGILGQELLGEDDLRRDPRLAIAPSDSRVEFEDAFRDVGTVGVAQREPWLDLTGNGVDVEHVLACRPFF